MGRKSKGGDRGHKTDALLTKEVFDVLCEQRKAFIARFGRSPKQDEPLVFDPESTLPYPVQMDEKKAASQMVEMMREAGIPEQFIYAFEKTGLILTKDMWSKYPKKTRDTYQAALDEYAEQERERSRSFEESLKEPYAFEGEVPFEFEVRVGEHKVTKKGRIVYKGTPDGDFFHPIKKKVVDGWLSTTSTIEMWDNEADEWVDAPANLFVDFKRTDGPVCEMGPVQEHLDDLLDADMKRKSEEAEAAHKAKKRK